MTPSKQQFYISTSAQEYCLKLVVAALAGMFYVLKIKSGLIYLLILFYMNNNLESI